MSDKSIQFIMANFHNLATWHQDWFKKKTAVFTVYKVRDNTTGKVQKKFIKSEDPSIRYRLTAPDFQAAQIHKEVSFPIAKCDEYESPARLIDLHVADLTGQMNFYNETSGPGSKKRRKVLHEHRFLHGTDVNVTDHYIDRFLEYYKDKMDNSFPLEMAFADIEVDGVDFVGFPDEFLAPVPVSLIQYFHAPTKKLHLYALTNVVRKTDVIENFRKNEQLAIAKILAETNRKVFEKEKLIPEDMPRKDLLEFLGYDSTTGDYVNPNSEYLSKYRCTSVEMNFIDDELSLIRAFLNQVNEVDRPDIIAFWNMSFDVNTMINRLLQLGADPNIEFTPKDFRDYPMAIYNPDQFSTEAVNKNDTFIVNGYTAWLDQQLEYAQLRKTSGKKDSYSLEYTLQEEIQESKHEYTGSIKDLLYNDYEEFIIYGAMDVVPMATLEAKLEDLAQIYQLSILTRTRIHKVLKKTICLRNLANVFFRDRGITLSNNPNANADRSKGEKFQGAWVADPKLMNYVGEKLGGILTNRIFDLSADFDAKALYPSILRSTNTDNDTQIGKLVLINSDGEMQRADKLITALASGDVIAIGKKWFNFPDLGELIDIVDGASSVQINIQ